MKRQLVINLRKALKQSMDNGFLSEKKYKKEIKMLRKSVFKKNI